MNAAAALTAVPSTETFGLPPEASHLIAKLRQMSPEQRAIIIHAKEDAA
ncbi:hypothetical protein PP640_gp62 [Arthrobacter phage Faja]|uniref:Uncharacterized protein n=1 Tax=Arthrobacter phage Faja TaxID=2419957 RepID=A0A3G2KFZ6_9CAUD|nr:hypothetical protein PP640_gp62 [Arthrobacter phage Faja]AYN57914.1 hypothetical protein PBI_FAJA_62 [Arthrobacter phage Faja]